MEKTRPRQFTLKQPGAGQKAAFDPRATYSSLTDTLLLYFYGGPEPAVNVDLEGSPLYLMTDPETGELVGVHIQAFTRRFLPDHPHFRAIDATRWASHEQDREPHLSEEDIALQRSLAEMVVGSLVIEYGLRAT